MPTSQLDQACSLAFAPKVAHIETGTLQTTKYNGHWLCDRTQGDFDGLLKATKIHWFMRKMFHKINYGAGQMRAELTTAPDFSTMTMITRAPMHKDDTTFPLDNSMYKTKSLDGQHIWAMLRWDGDEILANTEDGINLRFSSVSR